MNDAFMIFPHGTVNRKALFKFLVDAVNDYLKDLRFTMYKVQFEYLATDVACD